jgi:hypothetical protein
MRSKALLITSAIAGVIMSTTLSSIPAAAQIGREFREAEMVGFHTECERGNRRACVQFGIMIGENRGRHEEWRRLHRDWFWFEAR